MSTTTFDFGAVVLADFPFTDFSGSKRRPAVVVSSNRYNLSRPDVILMGITSRVRTNLLFGEILVADWHGANLLKPSAIKPILFTFEQSLITPIGHLQAIDREALRSVLSKILG